MCIFPIIITLEPTENKTGEFQATNLNETFNCNMKASSRLFAC